jgi:hypothetical protein
LLTINFVNTQLIIHKSSVKIDGKIKDILAEMIRLNSADSMTTMSDGTTQAANIYYCNEAYRVTNLVDDRYCISQVLFSSYMLKFTTFRSKGREDKRDDRQISQKLRKTLQES